MKIYISIPISGQNLDEVKKRAVKLKEGLTAPWNEVITPFDVNPDSSRPYSEVMGRDIQALLECDAVFFANGWEKSKGCNCEYQTAKIYDKRVFYESDLQNAFKINISLN